ncbi:MAG: ThuA domain-containing protein [Candidatus Latescibacteria bacterium]|nr:ThuA domain-containing protein [Candidatus Latescibacterota bacterium]
MGSYDRKKETMTMAGKAASVAAVTAASETQADIKPKTPGETKIVAVLGDYYHNPISQEVQIRNIFFPEKSWRIISVRSNRFFTPELIKDAELLITSRSSLPEHIDWNPQGLADSIDKGIILWSDENIETVTDNIKNRGMGFLALHCAIHSRSEKISDLLGVEPIGHNQVQPIWVNNLNGEHPITQGIDSFFINLDEQFGCIIKSSHTTTLFETMAIHDKRIAVGGWCLDSGKGRIVGLLPGHTNDPFGIPEYRKIIWRSAHWAMKRNIPDYNG